MAETRPSVSVIVPVFNCERYLAGALDSIYAQAYEPLEVIVLDDGSTDRSAEVARSYPARVIDLGHRGVARARNTGLEAARGDVITFLDADDLWTPGSLDRRIGRLLEEPDLGVVTGMMEYFVEPGAEPPPWYRPEWEGAPQDAFLSGALATLLAWRWVFDELGGFDPAYEPADDTDWLVRLKDSGVRHERLPDVLYRYRMHDANTTYRREVGPNLIKILRASIERQRVRSA